jgi:hypothetical protein|tara:strand:- start:496 stop:675 length:180 start_codon:yes stop_codon:yes gene_type:complete
MRDKEIIEGRLCKCGHDIDMHRFLKSVKPDACIFVFNRDDIHKKHKKSYYCGCDKFEEK